MLILCVGSSSFAQIRYKGYNFLILSDVYKYPEITIKDHNKRVDYHAGAIKKCKSYNMELASKNDFDLLVEFLLKKSKRGQTNTAFWLREIATGQISSNFTISETSKNYAYTLRYNTVPGIPQIYLDAVEKTSGHNSWQEAICIAKAAPIDDKYRIEIIKDDYDGYFNGKDALYGYFKNYHEDLGENNNLDKKYVEQAIKSVEDIVSNKITNLQTATIQINEDEKDQLKEETKNIINLFNKMLSFQEEDL